MEQEFDLFGDPTRLPSGKRGRPAHVPTQKTRNKVMMLLAAGWSNERIAGGVHCSVPTLKKYYFQELKARDMQRDRMFAWQIEKLAEQADAGNVAAIKEMNRMYDRNDRQLAQALMADAPVQPRQNIGKKELQRQAASDAIEGGSDWGDDLKSGYSN